MTSYQEVPLGEVISVLTDYHANGSYERLKANVSLEDSENFAVMIRTTNFEKNDFSRDLKFIDEHAYNYLAKSKVFPGDILMNKIANAGSVYLMPDLKRPVSLAMNLFLIRVDRSKCDQRYVYYYLKCHEDSIKLLASGAAASTITKESVRNFPIKLPDLKQQRAAADILDSFVMQIAANEKRASCLEQMADLLYQQWFVSFKIPTFSVAQQNVGDSTDLNQRPEADFSGVDLGSLVKISKGTSITREDIQPGTIPVVAGGLKPAYFHNQANVSGPVITVSASGANAGHVSLYQENIWASDCSFIDRGNTKFIYYYYLLLRNRQEEVFRLQRGSAQPHVYPKDLMTLKVSKFEEDLLLSFEDTVAPFFSLIKNLRTKNRNLADMHSALLRRILSGDIDVSQIQFGNIKEIASGLEPSKYNGERIRP